VAEIMLAGLLNVYSLNECYQFSDNRGKSFPLVEPFQRNGRSRDVVQARPKVVFALRPFVTR